MFRFAGALGLSVATVLPVATVKKTDGTDETDAAVGTVVLEYTRIIGSTEIVFTRISMQRWDRCATHAGRAACWRRSADAASSTIVAQSTSSTPVAHPRSARYRRAAIHRRPDASAGAAAMAGHTKLLKVPYFTQPTDNTCQSTVLKMFATYIEQNVLQMSGGAENLNPVDIYQTINADAKRPNKKFTNAHVNIKWWLEQRYPSLTFEYITTALEWEAIDDIVGFVDSGFPVLVAVSHANVEGHIILVVGYEGYLPNASSLDFKLVVHDPYGAFDPSLLSKAYGKQRYERGMCIQAGGEIGPGTGVRLDPLAASRQRKGDAYKGTFYLISASR
jgi:hypothetical protein